jgi:hypothetical protein
MKKVENAANVAATETQELTPAQLKATAILRARLPKLAEGGYNFEKRTGNFFTATVKQLEDGTERVARLVVADDAINPDAAAEVAAKRAAATVMNAERDAERLQKAYDETAALLDDIAAEIINHTEDVAAAVALVDAFELPEREGRVAATVKLASALSEVEKLRAMLVAAGINPDE